MVCKATLDVITILLLVLLISLCWFVSLGYPELTKFKDGRYYRDVPGRPDSSMLGPVQLSWLKGVLKSAKGVFKIIVTPVPITPGAKTNFRNSVT